MFDKIKPLLDSGIINEDTSRAINEAWEAKLDEARQEMSATLREEFSRKYEHDRNVMVEALDKMMSDNLKEEIQEFASERKAMNEERIKAQFALRETATKFNDFMVKKLAEEIKELRTDRKIQMENQAKLEKFIVKALAGEIKEFAQDRQAVVEAKVKLVAEGRKQIDALKKKFVAENSRKVESSVSKYLKRELSQLKEDIKIARENNFGRKLFEAFASEFSVTHLNDKAETRKILQVLENKTEQLEKAKMNITNMQRMLESKDREVNVIKESTKRDRIMNDLLSSLNEEKKQVMKTLLESVQSDRLKFAFDKYLPAVLNSGTPTSSSQKKPLVESRKTVVTGDKTAKKTVEVDPSETDNVIDLKRLAGL